MGMRSENGHFRFPQIALTRKDQSTYWNQWTTKPGTETDSLPTKKHVECRVLNHTEQLQSYFFHLRKCDFILLPAETQRKVGLWQELQEPALVTRKLRMLIFFLPFGLGVKCWLWCLMFNFSVLCFLNTLKCLFVRGRDLIVPRRKAGIVTCEFWMKRQQGGLGMRCLTWASQMRNQTCRLLFYVWNARLATNCLVWTHLQLGFSKFWQSKEREYIFILSGSCLVWSAMRFEEFSKFMQSKGRNYLFWISWIGSRISIQLEQGKF